MNLGCPLCRSLFDDDHFPQIVCMNLHRVCRSCINNSQENQCPSCQQQITSSDAIQQRLLPIFQQKAKFQSQELLNRKTKKKHEQLSNYFHAVNDIVAFNSSSRKQQQYDSIKSKAEKMIQEQHYSNATILLENLIQKHPRQNKFFGIGSKQEEKGFSQKCGLNWYKQKYEIKVLSVEDMLAFINLRNPQYEHQIAFYKKIHCNNRSNYKILFGLALTLHNTGNLDMALELYQKVIVIKPDFDKPYELCAFIYSQNNNSQKKLEYSRKCLKVNPNNIFAQFLLATQIKEQPQLSHQVNRLLKLQPRFCRAANLLGDYFLKIYQEWQAMRQYYACIQTNKQFIAPFISLGIHYFDQQNYFLAIQTLIQIVNKQKTSKQTFTCLFSIAICYNMLGQKQRSIEWFKRCIELCPDDKDAHHKLAQLYLSLDNQQEALKVYLGIANTQEDPWAYYLISQIYSGRQDYKSSIQWLHKSQRFQTFFKPSVQISLAENYYLMDKLQESLKYCRICIEKSYEKEQHYVKSIKILERQNKYGQLNQQIRRYISQCDLSAKEMERMCKIMAKIDKTISNGKMYQKWKRKKY